MTTAYRQKAQCPQCGALMGYESSFSRWLRECPELDSAVAGISVMDTDYIFHQFRTELGRVFQCLMIVELKTKNAEMSDAQRDTAGVLTQLLRNRRQTPTSELRWQAGGAPLKVRSFMAKREVNIKSFGFHVLTFDGYGPGDSENIRWDRKPITIDQLIALLKFDLDPDDPLRKMDWRSHHKKGNRQQGSFDLPLAGTTPAGAG